MDYTLEDAERENENLRATVAELNKEINNLQMSQMKLIAELGIIAQALGVEPNMSKVIAKIEELKKK